MVIFFRTIFQFFGSLSRRKFAHIFRTYTLTHSLTLSRNRRRKKKAKKRVSSFLYSQMNFGARVFLWNRNFFQHWLQRAISEGESKAKTIREKNTHFNGQTLAFIVDYLDSCNRHPFFMCRTLVVTFVRQTWVTTERTNYSEPHAHTIFTASDRMVDENPNANEIVHIFTFAV